MTETENARLTIIAEGIVQGVGYRAFVKRHATDLGLTGYAENLSDGRVEIVAEGRRSELEHLLVKLRMGPAHAEVKHLDINWGEVSHLEDFYTY